MEFLGVITRKEQTGASIFGDKNERIFGGEIGWGIVRDDGGVRCVSPDEYDALLKAHRAKQKKPQEKSQENLEENLEKNLGEQNV